MPRSRHRSSILFPLLTIIAVGLGCGDGTNAPGGAVPTGRRGVALQIAPGVTVSSATFAISGPNAFMSSGTVAVGATANVTVDVSAIPIGNGYIASMAAVASDGVTTCSGSTTFNVVSHPMPAPVFVHLVCGVAGPVGVTESTDICPLVDAIGASPASVRVGGSISLSAAAHDLDGGPGAIAFTWTATGGSLTGASTATPTFTCSAPGVVTATVAVTDGNPACVDSLSVDVTCTSP